MSITSETRRESNEKLDKKRLHDLIISTLIDFKEGMTARELAIELYNNGYIKSNERQATHPRLTELVDEKKVAVIGKKFDEISQRNVAVYALCS